MASITIFPGGCIVTYQGHIFVFNGIPSSYAIQSHIHTANLLLCQERLREVMRVARQEAQASRLEAQATQERIVQMQEETRQRRRESEERLQQLEVEGAERLRLLRLETRRLELSVEALQRNPGAESSGSNNNFPPFR
ncbi:uncharacterized protein LOC126582791 [Malus sylvestris]|uniref:uncharacterized protein LOC126582791 n=1 Tax=Malus sylvestris TaxID=3752 RepID=UPI0021ACE348|nr:uncharacterized protein LOC126582791 [Malus sylvestris]XP_050102944.1 uncharacterized protein LOC126582791 [Malus sylvestris]XP_050102945.1 uncharacterized protein LOC126582791 [Malus sylvestris]XP_050102946.1 uncharacterized protein LOC126582791 [Malus sylvestris]